MYSAAISDGSNLGLSKRSIRSLSVDGFDRSGGLCSESLTNVLETSAFPTFIPCGTERVHDTIVGGTCPILDAGRRNAGHDIDIGSQFAAVVVEG